MMKRALHGILRCLFLSTCTLALAYGYYDGYVLKVYSGYAELPTLTVERYSNVHVSDWMDYGTGTNEGRTVLSFSSDYVSGSGAAYTSKEVAGVLLGMELRFTEFTLFMLECIIPRTNVHGADVQAGLKFILPFHDYDFGFDFGAYVTGGLYKMSYLAGGATLLAGKNDPIILTTSGLAFSEADNLVFDVAGFRCQFGASFFVYLSVFGVGINGGYTLSRFREPRVKVYGRYSDGETLDYEDEGIVLPQSGSTTHVELDPLASASGFYWNVYVSMQL